MFFGRVKLADAVHCILAHTLRTDDLLLKKGRILQKSDITLLQKSGLETVIVARLEQDDVPEDEAAYRIAVGLGDSSIKVCTPFTGRVNLVAQVNGLVVVNRERLNQINQLDEAITIATVANWTPVQYGQIIATIKIIPFATQKHSLITIESLITHHSSPILHISPFQKLRVGLIQTYHSHTKESILHKTTTVTQQRLQNLGCILVKEQRCLHNTDTLSLCMKEIAKEVDLLLIIGISAIVDRRDVIPEALRRIGGKTVHFGMPVDPGNLLLLGRTKHNQVIIGLPGCARSPKENGFDWILQRLVAGLDVTSDDIMTMGVGGLLAEIPTRPHHKLTQKTPPPLPQKHKRIAALLLAAGQSKRMGSSESKLLTKIAGVPLIVRSFESIVRSSVDMIIVVLGHNPQPIQQLLTPLVVQKQPTLWTTHPSPEYGISSSLRCGLKALPDDIDGILVCLADMPWVTTEVINNLIQAFDPENQREICIPMVGTKRGNPVLWSREFLPELQALTGDVGARDLLKKYAHVVHTIPVNDPGVLLDIDTPTMLEFFT